MLHPMKSFLRATTLPCFFCFLLAGCQLLNTQNKAGLTLNLSATDLSTDSIWAPLEQAIEATLDSNAIPGAVLLLARNGEVIGHEAYGVSDPLTGERMDKDALFRICSQSKAIVSMSAMLLWERGAIGLDDPVSKYLPEFAGVGVLDTLLADTTAQYARPRSPLTVRHLMTHTSGIPYGEIGDERFEKLYAKYGVADLFPIDERSTRDNIALLAHTGLAHHPGEQWTYGLGLDVLVAVLEVASGLPYAEFLNTELLAPLGMDHTHFVVPENQRDALVGVFDKDSDGDWQHHTHRLYTTEYPTREDWPLCSGGAGLTSTAMDYARFLQMVLDRGAIPGGRLLKASTIDTLLADHAPGLLEGGWHQGLTFGVQNEPKGQGRFFWGGYFNTQYFGDPATGELVLIMKQTYGISDDSSYSTFSEVLNR